MKYPVRLLPFVVLSMVLWASLWAGSPTRPAAAEGTSELASAPFSDIGGDPYSPAIARLAARGIVGGYPDGTFRPDRPVLRAQLAKVICLTLRLPVVERTFPCPFPDVETPGANLYPDDYVTIAAANQIVTGYADGRFRPYVSVNRAEAISMVVRGLKGGWPELLPQSASLTASPWGDFDRTLGADVALAAEIGLLAGLPAASLDPWAPMTRGEVAQVLDTLADLVDGQTSESRFRPVLQPYHNHYYHYLGFASGVSTLSLQPVQAVVDRTFPESVPAYYAPLRPVPSGTDLAFRSWASPGQFPPGTEEILAWQDPAMEELLNLRRDLNNPHPPPLHDGRVVLPIFRSFLADHGLWQTDLGSGTAEWGQTVVGPGIYRAATVRVTFDQTGVSGDGTLPGQLRGDVAAGDRPVTLSWALLDPQVMGQVPLRPLGDVLLDTEAWLDGDVTWDRWPSPEGHDFALAVTGVFLDYERIRSPLTSDSVGLTLVPVYRFAVQVIGPADSRGATGLWTVCAAANATGTGN